MVGFLILEANLRLGSSPNITVHRYIEFLHRLQSTTCVGGVDHTRPTAIVTINEKLQATFIGKCCEAHTLEVIDRDKSIAQSTTQISDFHALTISPPPTCSSGTELL